MTSQGMMLTRRNVILVSDKQETRSDGKTYGGVDKIFELSQVHSAGLMTNGNADFENVPIDTLIGEFKSQTNFEGISNISEIADRFVEFLSQNTDYTLVDDFIKTSLSSFKNSLNEEFREMGFEKTVKLKQKREIPKFIENFPGLGVEFHDLIPDGYDKTIYNDVIWKIFSYEIQFEGTGIVIAGFDINNHFPSFVEFNLYCNDCGNVVYEIIDSAENCEKPFLKVFAINEDAYTFITGVSDGFIDYILRYVDDANDAILKNMKWNLEKEKINDAPKIMNIIKQLQNEEYGDMANDMDVIRLDSLEFISYSIETLPEWLLCIFADLLIRLTAVKQKTLSEIESVSLSNDILILSKIKDFNWIKNDEILF